MSRSDSPLSNMIAGGPRTRWGLVGVLAAVVAISLLHYLTHSSHEHWHVVYQRLYYIPILVGAVMYGLRGGLAVAILTAVVYLPHILLQWQHDPLYRSSQLAEIVLFLTTLLAQLVNMMAFATESRPLDIRISSSKTSSNRQCSTPIL